MFVQFFLVEDLKKICHKLQDTSKTFITDAQLNDLMSTIDENGSEAGARMWYEANKALVDGWYNN